MALWSAASSAVSGAFFAGRYEDCLSAGLQGGRRPTEHEMRSREGTAMPSYASEPTELVHLNGAEAALALGVRFDERGLVPAIVQQEGSGEVLMMAWMNAESLALTLETRTSWFWSRSRRELWNKGATSGNVQQVHRVLYDCDADTILLIVDSPGPACHTGHRSCFYREVALGDAVGPSPQA